MSSDDLTQIQVTLARIEERQEAQLHKVRNVDTKIDALAARMDRYVEKEDLIPLERRIDKVEGTQAWMVRSAVASATLISGGLYAVGKKFGVLS